MRKFIFILCLIFTSTGLFAQHGTDDGKTWYDDKKTKLKEVYSFKEVNILNPNDPYGDMKKVTKKHGPYFFYYESGKLKISGNYKNDQKHGEWKYYNEEGDITKIEQYKAGELVSTDENPGEEEDAEDEAGDSKADKNDDTVDEDTDEEEKPEEVPD